MSFNRLFKRKKTFHAQDPSGVVDCYPRFLFQTITLALTLPLGNSIWVDVLQGQPQQVSVHDPLLAHHAIGRTVYRDDDDDDCDFYNILSLPCF